MPMKATHAARQIDELIEDFPDEATLDILRATYDRLVCRGADARDSRLLLTTTLNHCCRSIKEVERVGIYRATGARRTARRGGDGGEDRGGPSAGVLQSNAFRLLGNLRRNSSAVASQTS